ncbi:MAG: hypothetical protein ACOCZY_00510, partial [Bacillota bacterium]
MRIKKTMLLVFVLILVVGLTGCDNWQTGIDETENATGPSWDMDLSIPLLPATTVDVGERIAEELGEDLDTDEEGNFKFNLLGEDDGPVIDENIVIDDFADQSVEFKPGLENVGFDDLDNVSFDNIDDDIDSSGSSTDQTIELNPEVEVKETETINVEELTKVGGFDYLEFTDGSIIVEIPDEFILSEEGVEITFAGQPLDRINDNTFSFKGVKVDEEKLVGDNDDEIEIEISFTIEELDGYDEDENYSADIRVEDSLEWEIRIKDYELDFDFDLDFNEIPLEPGDVTFVEGSNINFEIEGSDLTFKDIKLKIGDRETDENGEIDISGMTLKDLSNSVTEFSGIIPGDLDYFEITVNPNNLAWEVKAGEVINLINDEINTGENEKLFSEEIDLSELETDEITDYINPSAGSLEFLLDLTSDIEGLSFEFEGFVFDVDGERVEVDEFKIESGEVSELPEDKIDELISLIFESENKPETLTVEIDGIKAIDETDEFIIYPGENEVNANAEMNFYLEFEFVPDEDDPEFFIYRAEPDEIDIDQETRDALKNNLKSVEAVQEIVNELPFVGDVEIFIRKDDIDKDEFYDDENESVYSSGLIKLEEEDQKYRNQEDLGEDFIEALTEESPVYIGFRIKIPMDE